MYSFEYQRPATLTQAVEAFGEEGNFLAGGQSLVQAMKLRMASVSKLIDLGDIPELRQIAVTADAVTVGAMTRHAEVAHSAEVQLAIPALAALAGGIADQMVRNMGTLGGSLANADPAACYPAAVLALGATIQTDRRRIAADDFFIGLYQTLLEPGELIVSVSFPRVERAAYVKFKHPASRFAVVGAFVAKGAGGVRVAINGAKAHVFRATEIEQALGADFRPEAAASVVLGAEDMFSDMFANAEYRAALVSVIASRAVQQALL